MKHNFYTQDNARQKVANATLTTSNYYKNEHATIVLARRYSLVS